MASVTVDSSVLAIPLPNATKIDVINYIENLLAWKRMFAQDWVENLSSENLYEVLEDADCLPNKDSLTNLLMLHGLNKIFSAKDILNFINPLLYPTKGIQTQFNIRYVLLQNLVTQPDILRSYSNIKLLDEFKQCLVLSMLLRCHCTNSIDNHFLIVKPWIGRTKIEVNAQIDDWEHSRGDLKNLVPASNNYIGEIDICQNPNELIKCLDETEFWRSALDNQGKYQAIYIALYKSRLVRGMEPEWEKPPVFSFGSDFVKDAESCIKSGPVGLLKEILRAIVETLDEIKLSDTHHLRIDGGGNNPQIVRRSDNAKAWRRDIDYEYHIHYWKLATGNIEFANVIVHNNFAITT